VLSDISEEQRVKLLAALEVSAESEEIVELSFVLDEVFRCFDEDQDGQLEREEYLAGWEKLSTILDESFGPKQRKVKMQWFKDAGAEGTPTDGMYLSREKWQAAFLSSATADSAIPAEQDVKLGSRIWKSYAKKLVEVCFPSAKPAVVVGPDTPDGPPPEYPMTIPLTDLASKLQEAARWSRRPLILGSNCPEVGTYFKYKIPDNLTVDAGSLSLKKKEELKSQLKRGMDFEGLCAPILIQMGSGAHDINKVCCDEFPAEVFNGADWTPQVALAQGFISESMAAKLELDLSKWRDFHIIVYSELGLDDAKAKLSDKIPHFDKLATIVIDPDSIAK